MKRFHNGLAAEAAEEALALARNLPGGLILLVDDINRLASPENAVAALRVAQEFSRVAPSDPTAPVLRFVVPLWPTQAQAMLTGERPELRGTTLNLERYSTVEREQLASLSQKHSDQARDLIESLKGDPFLCGLVLNGLEDAVNSEVADMVRVSIESTLKRALEEAARLYTSPVTPGEVGRALDSFLELILKTAVPEPEWAQIRRDLGDRQADLIQALGRSNRLGWIENIDASEVWHWKHDRLRDALLGRWLAGYIGPPTDKPSRQIAPLLSDGGLAEAWALALVFLRTNEHQHAINLLGKWQPLALAESLRLGLLQIGVPSHDLLCSRLRELLEHPTDDENCFVNGPHWFSLVKLAQTNDPKVLDITKGLPKGRFRDEARFRNGDLQAGLDWISRHRRMLGFAPAEQSSLFADALAAFQQVVGERENTVAAIASLVRQPESTELALTLAGYLAWPQLGVAIDNAWRELPEAAGSELLLQAAWAFSRCCHTSDTKALRTILLRVRTLSDERDNGAASQRHWRFIEPLWHSRQWTFTRSAIEAWSRIGSDCEDLRSTVRAVLRGQDDPVALETCLRLSALSSGFYFDLPSTPSPWPEADESRPVPTSEETRRHLWDLAMNDSEASVASLSFNLWKAAATLADLRVICAVRLEHHLYADCLRVRLRLQDATAAEELCALMQTDPASWCAYAPLLWNHPGIEEAFFDNLDAALDPDRRCNFTPMQDIGAHYAEQMLSHLPARAIRRLIREKAALLTRLPDTWVHLFRSEVDLALRFFCDALRSADAEALEFVFWGAGTFPYSVTRRMLDALVPALDQLPGRARTHLAELALHSGHIDWARQYTQSEACLLESKGYCLTAEAVWATLDGVVGKLTSGARTVLRDGDFLRLTYRSNERWVGSDLDAAVREWLGTHPSDEKIIIAAMYVEYSNRSGAWAWWGELSPQSDLAREAWDHARFMLQRRHWQGENWFMPKSD